VNASTSNRVFARVLPLDIPFWLAVPPLYAYTLGVHDTKRMVIYGVLTCVLRTIIWAAYARAELAPITAWERASADERSDGLLERAVIGHYRSPFRLTMSFALCWLLWMIFAGVFAAHDAPGGLGPRFWIVAAMACASPGIGGATLVHGIVTGAMREAKHGVLEEAGRRGIHRRPAGGSVRVQIATLALAMAMVPIGWLSAMGMRAGERDAVQLAEYQARSAAHLLSVQGQSETAGEQGDAILTAIVDVRGPGPSELPTALVKWARSEAKDQARAVYSVLARDQSWAFERMDDGRLALALAPVSADNGMYFLYALFGFMGIIVVWAPISAYSFGGHVGANIGLVRDAAGRVTEVGDLQKMQAVPLMSGDETGELARHFNQLLDTMRDLAQAADRVSSGELEVEIAGRGDLPNAFRGMLEGLKALVGQAQQTSVELTHAAAEIYSASQEQEAAAAQQTSGITEVSRTIESLSSASGHVAEASANVLSDAESTRATTDQMVERIAELNSHASRIGELLEVIREVADKSDLLALNGSLEAARAGDAGRGFALVATEMRRLAERVTKTVESVRDMLTDIRASGSSTVMATDQSRKLAESTTQAARRISLLTQQQRSAMEQVSASAAEIASVISQAGGASTQQRVSAENLKRQADRLEDLLKRFGLQSA